MATVYTQEFRTEAVRLVIEGERPLTGIARDLGVNTWTLRGWVKAHRDKLRASQPARAETVEEGNQRLKRRISTREDARRDIFAYIEVFYNRERRHSSLGYMTPADYERQLANKQAA